MSSSRYVLALAGAAAMATAVAVGGCLSDNAGDSAKGSGDNLASNNPPEAGSATAPPDGDATPDDDATPDAAVDDAATNEFPCALNHGDERSAPLRCHSETPYGPLDYDAGILYHMEIDPLDLEPIPTRTYMIASFSERGRLWSGRSGVNDPACNPEVTTYGSLEGSLGNHTPTGGSGSFRATPTSTGFKFTVNVVKSPIEYTDCATP